MCLSCLRAGATHTGRQRISPRCHGARLHLRATPQDAREARACCLLAGRGTRPRRVLLWPTTIRPFTMFSPLSPSFATCAPIEGTEAGVRVSCDGPCSSTRFNVGTAAVSSDIAGNPAPPPPQGRARATFSSACIATSNELSREKKATSNEDGGGSLLDVRF